MSKFILHTWYAIKELYYWGRLRKIIKKHRNTTEWKKWNIRVGWVNQLYTVISLKDEYMGEEEPVQKLRVLDQVMPLNKYISSLDASMQDIVAPEIVKEPDTQSWIVIYWPLFRYFSIWKSIKWLLYISILYIAIRILSNKFGEFISITWEQILGLW